MNIFLEWALSQASFEILFLNFGSLMRNRISQGLGRKQKLTQMAFWKIYLMKGLWWPHGGGQASEVPQGMSRHPGTNHGRKLGPPFSLKDKVGGYSQSLIGGQSLQKSTHTHPQSHSKAERGEGDPTLLSSQPLTPPLAEPNQKSKVRSPAGAFQKSRLLGHGAGQGRGEGGYGQIQALGFGDTDRGSDVSSCAYDVRDTKQSPYLF